MAGFRHNFARLARILLILSFCQGFGWKVLAQTSKALAPNLGEVSYLDPKGRFVIIKTKKPLAKGHQFCIHAEAEKVLACTGVVIAKGKFIAVKLTPEEAKLLKVGMVSELKDLYIKNDNAGEGEEFIEVGQKKADLSKLRDVLFKEEKIGLLKKAPTSPPEPTEPDEPGESLVATMSKSEIKTVYQEVFGPKKGENEFKKVEDNIPDLPPPLPEEKPSSENKSAPSIRETTKIVEVEPKAKKQSLKIDLRYLSLLSKSISYNQLSFRTVKQESGSTDSLWNIKKKSDAAEVTAIGLRLQWVINFKHLLLIGINVTRHAPLIAQNRYDEQVTDYIASVEQTFRSNHFYVGYGRKIPLLHWAYASWAGGLQLEDSQLAFNAHRDEKSSGIQQEIIAFGEYAFQLFGLTGMFDLNASYKDFVFTLGFDMQWYFLTMRDEFQGSVVIPFAVNSNADPRQDLRSSLAVKSSNPGLAIIFAFGYEPY